MESRDENGHTERSCAIQSNLDALLRNSVAQEKTVSVKKEKQTGTGGFWGTSTQKTGTGMTKTATKGGVANSTRIPMESSAHSDVTLDAITWAHTWEIMNRTLEAFVTRNTESIDREGGKSRKTFQEAKGI